MTGISKKVYITKLDKLVKKCNYTYYETIKTKLVDVQQDNMMFKITTKIINSKFLIM